jgi:3-oxosteroid 1-dehydrogenase
MSDWDEVADLVIVGSGGGAMCAALAARDAGLRALVIEKQPVVGGSTAMSGGVLWLPDNPVSKAAGVLDSREDARRYLAATVGDAGPSTSPARTEAFLDAVTPLVEFLQSRGIPLRHCEGYSDYYDDRPGGKARGRSLETELFDVNELGPWLEKFPLGVSNRPVPILTSEVARATLATKTVAGAITGARIAWRGIASRARGRQVKGSGPALQGRMLKAVLAAEVPVWTDSPVIDLIVAEGRVRGVLARRGGRELRVRADRGVLLNSGGFSRSERMRKEYGRDPASTAWTSANKGDTGEVMEAAMRCGAAVDLMDEAWWIPSSMQPDGRPLFAVHERSKPYAIMVDGTGQRYTNEAASYMEVGQAMYERNKTVTAVPSWWITDSRNRRRYMWGQNPPGRTKEEWLSSGYFVKADTIEELATRCGLPAGALRGTVDRYNESARHGVDPDYHKGERAYDRYYGDPACKPNPCVGPVSEPPFYAVRLYPGDVGTGGGLLTDEHARVMSTAGTPIPGLYACGNCTASVMGRCYPGAGASIGASFVFGWLAALHAAGDRPMSPAEGAIQ